ncbi:uncharacterized protein LOC110988496 isoform X2 [Acanthaster planci]|uniref:Uncharacterized protein LOC110988496 isoform X2 n=1 Tax=Acanthaster planci TaxID=133434 RepID=A0A8B7ZRQ2_ACAPL|nr:uncharacterized protein LOC110988496 isoform X2 [Acanthaster planci]
MNITKICFLILGFMLQPAKGMHETTTPGSDMEAPNVTCPSNITGMGTDTGVRTAVVDWLLTPTSIDNVDIIDAANITCEDDSGNVVMSGGTYDLGTTTVTCTVNDTALNEGSCQFTIGIVDMEAPTVTCPSNITGMGTDTGVRTAVVNWLLTPTAIDNVDSIDAANITCEDDSGNVVMSGGTYDLGTTTVTCKVNDTTLNEGSCQFTIGIEDTEAPNVTCPSNITGMGTNTGVRTAVVNWLLTPTAIDNVDTIDAANITCEDDSGNVVMSGGTYDLGTTTVMCQVNDTALNEGSCQFIISIVDTELPIITCPSNITGMGTDTGVRTAVVNWSLAPTAIDNVDTIDAASIICQDGSNNVLTSGSTYDVGTTTVTCRVSDTALNEGSCLFTITVVDDDNPSVTCPNNPLSVMASFGNTSATVSWPSVPSATDNVNTINAASIICQDDSGNVVISGGTYVIGVTTVTCRVRDSASNEGSCQFTVTVAACGLDTSSCANGGTFDGQYCECVCPLTHSGETCAVANPCLNSPGTLCSDATTGQYCLPSLNATGYVCLCRTFDGYFRRSNACTSRPSIIVIIRAPLELFRDVFNNPTSTAFQNKAAILRLLVLNQLGNDSATSSIVSVDVINIQSGSIVVTMVLEFPENQVPPRADVIRVLSTTNLSDGTLTIPIDPTVTVQDATTACATDYCSYGGVCVKSGYYFPELTYTCSCQTSFTGERCDTVITIPTEPSTVTPITTETPQGGISTLALVLIVVGCVLLLFSIVGLFLCFLFLQPRQYARGLIQRDYPSKPVTTFVPIHDHRNTHPDDTYRMSNEMRKDHLRHQISWPPYMKQGLSSRREFIRPYVASGMEGSYINNPLTKASAAGPVVYNPSFSHYL